MGISDVCFWPFVHLFERTCEIPFIRTVFTEMPSRSASMRPKLPHTVCVNFDRRSLNLWEFQDVREEIYSSNCVYVIMLSYAKVAIQAISLQNSMKITIREHWLDRIIAYLMINRVENLIFWSNFHNQMSKSSKQKKWSQPTHPA